uniref:AIG1-type G domain-containing protein n=1 Tax=Hucho hucho TaxID=62062 RepID=A0A4W5LEJ4_9TELE
MAAAERVAVVLLGGRWAGKSSSGNSLLGLDSSTGGFNVGKQTDTCIMKETKIDSTLVSVIDTPSWMWVPAVDTSEEVKGQLKRSVILAEQGGHPAFLLVYPLGSPFLRRHKVAVEEHLALLGEEEEVWGHTMVLFSRGDWLAGRGTSIEEHIQTAGPELLWLLEKCGNRYHVINNKEKEMEKVKELLQKIKEMVRKREEMADESEEIPPVKRRRKSMEEPNQMTGDKSAAGGEVGEPSGAQDKD